MRQRQLSNSPPGITTARAGAMGESEKKLNFNSTHISISFVEIRLVFFPIHFPNIVSKKAEYRTISVFSQTPYATK
jgi:hypothetical protein